MSFNLSLISFHFKTKKQKFSHFLSLEIFFIHLNRYLALTTTWSTIIKLYNNIFSDILELCEHM